MPKCGRSNTIARCCLIYFILFFFLLWWSNAAFDKFILILTSRGRIGKHRVPMKLLNSLTIHDTRFFYRVSIRRIDSETSAVFNGNIFRKSHVVKNVYIFFFSSFSIQSTDNALKNMHLAKREYSILVVLINGHSRNIKYAIFMFSFFFLYKLYVIIYI